jgi:SAM-dependent methyltransferase
MPRVADPTRFRSGLLPTAHFNNRFSDENVAFWVPLLIDVGGLTAVHEVLDVGCGTGGFARAIAARTSATVTGVDEAKQFVAFAREASSPGERVSWEVANAEALPFPPSSFDRVLLSLVLHQLADPVRAVNEAFRVLRSSGVVLVRSIAPDDAPERVPERFVPSMAAADAARMPPIATICEWLSGAGFVDVNVSCHSRNKVLNIEEEEAALRAEVAGRYAFVSAAELEEGVQRMRAEAQHHPSSWIDPRPTYMVTATKRR